MIMLGIVVLFGVSSVFAAYSILPEPERDKLIAIKVIPQRMALLYFYDTDDDGQPDYTTQRRILPDSTVELEPSFYMVDINDDGNVDMSTEVWVDVEEDGINGNEILYSKWLELQNEEA